VLYGYCPGTGLAAIATGSVHALVGAAGMLFGAMLYAFSFEWVRSDILSVWRLGRVTLPELMGVTPLAMYIALGVFAVLFFWAIEAMRVEKR
jgi:hypothetical protein